MTDILELRDSTGVLRAFEVPESYTNLWALCRELENVPSLIFPDRSRKASFFSAPPVCEFLFQAERYQIHHISDGFWVGPAEDGVVLPPTELLLNHIRHHLISRRWHRLVAAVLPS